MVADFAWLFETLLDQEVVGYTALNRETGDQNVSLMVGRAPNSRSMPVENRGAYVRYAGSFFLPSDSTVTPKVKDHFHASDRTWTVYAVGEPILGSPWMLHCVSLELEPALATTIQIIRPKDTIDALLSPLTQAGLTVSGIPAAIVQTRADAVTFLGKQGFRKYYEIFSTAEVDVPLGTAVKDAEGHTYIVSGTRKKNRIDEYQVIEGYSNP